MIEPICTPNENNDWTKEKIAKVWGVMVDLAQNKYGLELPDLAFEIHDRASLAGLTAAWGGIPTWIPHWTTGQQYLREIKQFRENGSRYRILEMIIHSNPCVCYLMSENTMIEQIMVMAHAAIGHANLFHKNYLFEERSHASNILAYMEYANKYITKCEDEHGTQVVEMFMDACLVWSQYAVDHNYKMRDQNRKAQDEQAEAYRKKNDNDYNRRVGIYDEYKMDEGDRYDDNILRYIQKTNPRLDTWEKEILQIFRTLNSYFYPYQRMKTMHEGWAMLWEGIICKDLFDLGYLDMKGYTNILHFTNHHMRSADVMHSDPSRGLLNAPDPYHYGLKIFEDIKRMCESPTEEDHKYYPRIAGTDWLETCKDIAYNNRDQTFCSYYTSPTVAKDMGLMTTKGIGNNEYLVTGTQLTSSHGELQKSIFEAYDPRLHIPDISVDTNGAIPDQFLTLEYTETVEGLILDYDELMPALRLLKRCLWKGKVIFNTQRGPVDCDYL